MTDSFKARTALKVGAQQYEILSLDALKSLNVGRLPFSLKILLENLLRFEDGVNVTKNDIEALLKWDPKALPSHEIAFTPARVIMQTRHCPASWIWPPCTGFSSCVWEAIRSGSTRWRRTVIVTRWVDEYGAQILCNTTTRSNSAQASASPVPCASNGTFSNSKSCC